MMTLREAYAWLRSLSDAAHGGDLNIRGADVQKLLDVLAEALRTTGHERPWTVEERLTRLERSFFDDGEWVSEPWRRAVENVSEGAQRDSADLHRRVSALETRLTMPDPDGMSWALLTTPEATAAIGRLETELAEFRKREADRDYDRRAMLASIQVAEKVAESAQQRAKGVEVELRGVRKSITQLQAQWQNIRNRIKALLSSAS